MKDSFTSVIRVSGFRTLWFAQITSQVALNMLMFILAIRVYSQTSSNGAVSLMLLCFGVPSIIFGVAAGGVVDHFDKKKILFFCNIVRVVLLFLFFIFSKFLPPEISLAALILLSILISIITQLFIPAEAPSIPRLVRPDQLLTANSLFTVTFYLSAVLGFILAGPAIEIFGDSNVYLVTLFFMALATLFVQLLPSIPADNPGSNKLLNMLFIKNTIIEGLKYINRNSRIKQSLILMTFSQALVTTLSVLAPGFADRILRIALTNASYIVIGPAAVGLVVGAMLVGNYGARYLKGKIILSGIFGCGIILIILSLVSRGSSVLLVLPLILGGGKINHLLFTLVLLFFLGIFNSMVSVPANTILQQDAGSKMQGRVYGVLTALTGGVSLLPVVFSGFLADAVGVSRTLIVIGTFVFIVAVYQFYLWKNASL